ncbi:tetratricopeptide repeat protein [Psychroserpens sp. Hel_I_66]|uniref:tetratricopeptide repeat-containing sensor histidine kinase n=1 Tax=Psychroserpens sp. Hel_I_66 TaxID=1250004 RepID=UPI0006482854|nr:tetratricopeptide repeat protein [Psychroserpens sp. Hel_I_66]
MKRLYFSFIFIFLTCYGFSQNSALDLNLSAMEIYKSDPNQALDLLDEGLKISEEKKDKNLIARSKNNIGIVYRDLGRFEEAKILSQEALLVNDSLILASAYNNIGVVNRNLGLYDEALTSYLKALRIYEAKGMNSQIATTHNAIGLVYSYNGINNKAIEYHLKAKTVFEKLDNKKGISEVYNNIAIIYANEGDLEKALNYFKYSLEIEEGLNDKKGIAESLNNVGAVYYYMESVDSALVYFKKSATLEKSIGNLAGLAASYNNIADVLLSSGNIDNSKTFIDSAYYYANNSKVSVDIETALANYSAYYESKNDLEKAISYHKQLAKFKDSTLNIETNEKIATLEISYQTEKKEKEILSQRADLAEKELSLNKKNTQLLGLIILAVLLVAIGYLFYNQQRLKNRQLQKENELKDALIKIETQNHLQEQRLRISRDLHDNIGAQLTFIISSIDNLKYGFDIKDHKLTNKLDTISEFTTSTIYELRDTIWAMNKTEISLEDLQSRVSNFIDKANLAADGVDFDFTSNTTEIGNLKFSSVQGMNIYRIIQESINNALKYSEAKHIKVVFSSEENTLIFKIIDDGKGFDVETATMGNGINNMKKRAYDIGANLDVKSKINQGSHIVLKLSHS